MQILSPVLKNDGKNKPLNLSEELGMIGGLLGVGISIYQPEMSGL